MFLICALIGLMCAPAPALEAAPGDAPRLEVAGRASVEDGDTLGIGGVKVRLQGLDAPESGQPCEDEEGRAWRCGQAAALALEAMIAGRVVTCEADPRDAADRYGRMLGMCRAGGTDLNLALVRAGHAVAYRRYLDYADRTPRPHKGAFIDAERAARLERIGLWRGRFTLPEEWRRLRRNGR